MKWALVTNRIYIIIGKRFNSNSLSLENLLVKQLIKAGKSGEKDSFGGEWASLALTDTG